jgi:hypothetical protein
LNLSGSIAGNPVITPQNVARAVMPMPRKSFLKLGFPNIVFVLFHIHTAGAGVPGVDVHTVPLTAMSASVAASAKAEIIAASFLTDVGFLMVDFRTVIAMVINRLSSVLHIFHYPFIF